MFIVDKPGIFRISFLIGVVRIDLSFIVSFNNANFHSSHFTMAKHTSLDKINSLLLERSPHWACSEKCKQKKVVTENSVSTVCITTNYTQMLAKPECNGTVLGRYNYVCLYHFKNLFLFPKDYLWPRSIAMSKQFLPSLSVAIMSAPLSRSSLTTPSRPFFAANNKGANWKKWFWKGRKRKNSRST